MEWCSHTVSLLTRSTSLLPHDAEELGLSNGASGGGSGGAAAAVDEDASLADDDT